MLSARAVHHKPLAECLDDAIKQAFHDRQKHQIKIIDAGAGTGLMGVELDKLGYTNLHALDISPKMLDEAKKKNVYENFICAPLNDQRNPEIETGEFDALICVGVLVTGHVRSSAFVEMVRMVKTGEILLQCTNFILRFFKNDADLEVLSYVLRAYLSVRAKPLSMSTIEMGIIINL